MPSTALDGLLSEEERKHFGTTYALVCTKQPKVGTGAGAIDKVCAHEGSFLKDS